MLTMATVKSQPEAALAAFEAHTFAAAGGDTLPYRVLWPEGYRQGGGDTRYPLVVLLHGAGERGNDNRLQMVHGTPLFLNNRTAFPAIVVLPQCATDDYWAQMEKHPDGSRTFNFDERPNPSLAAVMELVDYFAAHHAVDTQRRYLMGLSMGAMGTFEYLARCPDTFAAAVAICGGTQPALLPLYAHKVPLWIFHGDADPVVTVDNSRRIVKALEGMQVAVRYTEYSGVGHGSWDNAFAEPELLAWLFGHRKMQ